MRLSEITKSEKRNQRKAAKAAKRSQNIDISDVKQKQQSINQATGYSRKSTFVSSTRDMYSKYPERQTEINAEIIKFIKIKQTEHILAKYNKTDSRYSSILSDYSHVHLNVGLNPPLVLIYKIEGRTILLCYLTQHEYNTTREVRKLVKKLNSTV